MSSAKVTRSGLFYPVRGMCLLAITGVLVAACNDQPAPASAAESRTAAVQRVVRDTAVPGMVIAVITSNTIDTAASGVLKLGQTPALTTQHRMHLGSNIKAMTATLAACLVGGGLMQWSTTIASVFPELRATMRPEYLNVTVDDLLAHRGGILPFVEPAEFEQLPALPADEVLARAALTAWLVRQSSPVRPKIDTLYSNAGYVVVAAMMERLARQRYEDLLSSFVLIPFGIVPKFNWPAAADAAQPWGHEWLNGRWTPSDPDAPGNLFPAYGTPAGNLSLSVSDYARFVQLHLRGLRGNATLITADSYQHLHTPQGRMALGWISAPLDGVRTSAHDGTAGTFYALAAIQPDRDRAVVVLVNAYSSAVADAANALALQLLGRGP